MAGASSPPKARWNSAALVNLNGCPTGPRAKAPTNAVWDVPTAAIGGTGRDISSRIIQPERPGRDLAARPGGRSAQDFLLRLLRLALPHGVLRATVVFLALPL